MPPTKKYNLNSILQYKNYSKNLEVSHINEDRTSTNNISDINCINNTTSTNTSTAKSLDNYFGISEKPPSPIPEIIYDRDELTQNTKLSLSEIKNRIDNLYETELIEIFKIIKDNKEKYTTNNNGIFINICNIKPVTLTEITNFLIFSEKNNKLIDKEEEERNIYRDLIS
jgi:hypothetical protein